MNEKFWLCKRGKVFFALDSSSGKRESLRTKNRDEARQLLQAKNDAVRQPTLNIVLAKAYLVGADAKLIERTWSYVIQEFCSNRKENSRHRLERAFKRPAFSFIHNKKLIETTAEDFFSVIRTGGVFAQHLLRCLHNLALGMGWLLAPIIPPRLWPQVKKKHRRAITHEEHQKIIENENNTERRLYYELLWEIGSAQTDGANLNARNIDWGKRLLSYHRQKTGEICLLEIGSKLEGILKHLPTEGALFPKISILKDKDRAAEFHRRCRILKIDGISLHSYRYAWAARAKQFGMPERYAQSALGHASLAVHRAYARDGMAICPSIEKFEIQKNLIV